jgi:very-short-patch-repair endonuclease
MLPYDNHLKKYSQQLRKNMTDAEKALWARLRSKQIKGYQFYRQKPIGDFIADFYCPKGKLIVKLDGGQRYSEERKAKDNQRDNYLEGMGLIVLRFSDREVFDNMRGVLKRYGVIYDL